MPVGYRPRTPAERCQIHARLHRRWSKREMARDLGRDPGTISRETSRHRGQRGDRHPQARADRQAGGTRYRCRRRRGQQPNGRGGRPAGRGHIPDRVDLAERPSVVAEKSRIVDWEREPILGARPRGALVSAVDRGSKFPFLEWVEGQTAAAGHRGAHPAPGTGSGPGPHRHGRPRQGVREASGDRTEARCGLLLRHPLPLLRTGPERAPQRPGARVLPEGHRLPPGDSRAGAGGGGPAPPSASEGPGVPHPGGGLCPWVGSPPDAARGRPSTPALRALW